MKKKKMKKKKMKKKKMKKKMKKKKMKKKKMKKKMNCSVMKWPHVQKFVSPMIASLKFCAFLFTYNSASVYSV